MTTTMDKKDKGQQWHIKLEPGRYYVGDPCYVLTYEFWDDELATSHGFGVPGAIIRKDTAALVVAMDFTYYGDGSYTGEVTLTSESGVPYTAETIFYVDSGTIGVVRLDDNDQYLRDSADDEFTLTLTEGGAFETDGRGWFAVTGPGVNVTINTAEVGSRRDYVD
jgi:hypothetical protein